ncbi:hypothetical protein RAG88_01400, partial [Klebsiella pneumoniae]
FLAGFRVVCCLFYRFPVRNALRGSEAVPIRDVMVNDNNRNTVVNVIFRLKITKKSTNITYSIIRR